MSQKYLQQALDIIEMTLLQLKTIQYNQFARNHIRTLLKFKKNKKLQENELEFRNNCFAVHSLIQQELYNKNYKITTTEELEKTMKNNRWVK